MLRSVTRIRAEDLGNVAVTEEQRQQDTSGEFKEARVLLVVGKKSVEIRCE